MSRQMDLAKFLCARHGEILQGIKRAKPNHFISIDEIDPEYDEKDEMHDVLIDLTCEGTEYRLRMGMRSILRVTLTRFVMEGEDITDVQECLTLQPEGNEFDTLKEFESYIIESVANVLD